jgi:hypothetical protein
MRFSGARLVGSTAVFLTSAILLPVGCGETSSDDHDYDGAGGSAVISGGSKPTAGGSSNGGTSTGGSTSGRSSTGGAAAGGVTTGGSSSGGRAASGEAGADTSTGGTSTGGTSTGGATSGGISGSGAAGDTSLAGSDAGGATSLPDASCVVGCEVAPLSTACDQALPGGLSWVCFDPVPASLTLLRDAGCIDLFTQVPRYCCSAEFAPCE